MTDETKLNGLQVLSGRTSLGRTRAQFCKELTEHASARISPYQLQNIERNGSRLMTEDEERQIIALFALYGVNALAIVPSEEKTTLPIPPMLLASAPRGRPLLNLLKNPSPANCLSAGPARKGTRRMFSNSEFMDFGDCRRRWWLRWYRGITQLVESPTGALAIGKRVHRALEALYVPEGQEAQNPGDVLERLILQDWTALLNAGMYSDELEAKFNTEANLERAMISGYVEWLAETGEDATLRVIQSESYLEATLLSGEDLAPGTGITEAVLIGKIDIRVALESDNSRRVVDTKTATSFPELEERLRLGDPQMMTYLLLEWLNTDEGEARCNGALFNALRKVKRTASAKPPFYKRMVANYSDVQLESFRTRVEGQMTDILAVETDLARGVDPRSVAWPRPSKDCSWKCQFKNVCPMFDDGSAAESYLAAVYTTKDPFSYYQTQGDVAE